MTRSEREVLADALAHFDLMQEHAARGLHERLVLDAVCMRLSAGIEALANLDGETRSELFGADWPLMWGLRNRIAHGYLLIDHQIIEATLARDIPRILPRMRQRTADSSP